MKKIFLYTVIISLFSTFTAYAVGLGEITIHSYLNQPFDAEIELIDIGSTPISGIKASVASVDDFERMELERANSLDLLIFNIEKNQNGKPVIRVRSVDRVTEPYLQLLIDLAWNKGQVYRAYTVLLDPPEYKLLTKKRVGLIAIKASDRTPAHRSEEGEIIISEDKESPAAEKKSHGELSYGPTMANETIWQIAQRYKTPDVILQQIILAIVGENEPSFAEGNLNGMKPGVQLKIPSSAMISMIPADKAKLEVFAHDTAWQSKQPIHHVLLPPYIDANADSKLNDNEGTPLGYAISISKLPGVPVFADSSADMNASLLPKLTSFLSAAQDVNPAVNQAKRAEQQLVAERVKAEINIATTAIESVREANHMLTEQLHLLQKQNKQLQQQLLQRDKDIKALQQQMLQITQRQGLAGQAIQAPMEERSSSFLPWLLALLLIALGLGIVYWLWQRSKSESENDVASFLNQGPSIPPSTTEDLPSTPSVILSPMGIASELPSETTPPVEDTPVHNEPLNEPNVVFIDTHEVDSERPALESGDLGEEPLQRVSETLEEKNSPQLEEEPANQSEDEHVLEFEPGMPLDIIPPSKSELPTEPKDDERGIDFVPEPIVPQPTLKSPNPSKDEDILEEDHGLEFVSDNVEPMIEPEKSFTDKQGTTANIDDSGASVDAGEPTDLAFSKPTKSKRALNTLLDLAKTYISMDDKEAARQSLEEVLEHGSEEQKLEAQSMLKQLEK